jgi:hypothetical protein
MVLGTQKVRGINIGTEYVGHNEWTAVSDYLWAFSCLFAACASVPSRSIFGCTCAYCVCFTRCCDFGGGWELVVCAVLAPL